MWIHLNSLTFSRAGVVKWFTVSCLLHAARAVMGSSPGQNLHQCLGTHLYVCGLKRLGCHVDLCTVNRCHTRGSHKWETMKGIHPGFETQGRRHQKSKTGVSVAPRKGLLSSKIFLKKTLWHLTQMKKVLSIHTERLNMFTHADERTQKGSASTFCSELIYFSLKKKTFQ